MRKDTLRRFNSLSGAASYRRKYERSWRKRISHWRECRIIDRLLRPLGVVDSVLDMPCGVGRLCPTLHRFTRNLWAADASEEMLAMCREGVPNGAGWVAASVFDAPWQDGRFDGVCSIRLAHHLWSKPELECYLRQMARIANHWLVISFRDRDALHAKVRQTVRRLRGRQSIATAGLIEIREFLSAQGMELAGTSPVFWIFSDHRIALFRRVQPVSPAGRHEPAPTDAPTDAPPCVER